MIGKLLRYSPNTAEAAVLWREWQRWQWDNCRASGISGFMPFLANLCRLRTCDNLITKWTLNYSDVLFYTVYFILSAIFHFISNILFYRRYFILSAYILFYRWYFVLSADKIKHGDKMKYTPIKWNIADKVKYSQ